MKLKEYWGARAVVRLRTAMEVAVQVEDLRGGSVKQSRLKVEEADKGGWRWRGRLRRGGDVAVVL